MRYHYVVSNIVLLLYCRFNLNQQIVVFAPRLCGFMNLTANEIHHEEKYTVERASLVLLLNTTFITVKAAAIDAVSPEFT